MLTNRLGSRFWNSNLHQRMVKRAGENLFRLSQLHVSPLMHRALDTNTKLSRCHAPASRINRAVRSLSCLTWLPQVFYEGLDAKVVCEVMFSSSRRRGTMQGNCAA